MAGLAVYEHDDDGSRPRVVFVHGSMDRGASFLKTVRRLPELHCVRYDRRGYGRSVALAPTAGFEVQVDDLVDVIGTGPAVVIGHSLGGVIALCATQRRSDLVSAVGVFEAPMGWAAWWPAGSAGNDAIGRSVDAGPEEAAERFMRRIIGDERWERLPPSTRAARRAEGPALVAEITALRRPTPPYDASALTRPLVVGLGARTAPQHLRASRELASTVPGADLMEIDGAGHDAPTSHPDQFAAFVRATVARANMQP